MTGGPLLSWLIWLPIMGGITALATGSDTRVGWARWWALAVSTAAFVLSIALWVNFDSTTANMQWTELHAWIPSLHVNYALGVDGISMPLIVLSNFCTVLVVLAGWRVIDSRVSQYMAAFLIMSGLMTGVFAAMDAILFYVFWEATLVPMFLIIGIWGGPNRIYATLKFFLYTFLGSVLMLVALLYLYTKTNSFALTDFYQVPLTMTAQIFIFFAFLLAFAVKVPMWPVHTWLPDAHVEAPTGGSVILAAIMLKMGGYGFIRFSMPIVPDACHTLANMMIVLSLIAVVYIGFVAIVQKDMKKLIAYSSIAHMGFVTLGFFMIYAVFAHTENISAAGMGVEGAMVQMVSHGFISAALFLCVGVLYDRLHSRLIHDYGGVANVMPVFAAFFMLFALANTGLPGTSGFVGEFLVVLTAFKAGFWIAVIAATTLILSPAYTLWMYKRVVFGEIANLKVATLTDVVPRERLVLALLALSVLALGLWPQPLQQVMHASVDDLVTQSLHSKLLVKPVF